MIVKNSEHKPKFERSNIPTFAWFYILANTMIFIISVASVAVLKISFPLSLLIPVIVFSPTIIYFWKYIQKEKSKYSYKEELEAELQKIHTWEHNFETLDKKQKILQELKSIETFDHILQQYQQEENQIEKRLEDLYNSGSLSQKEQIFHLAKSLTTSELSKIKAPQEIINTEINWKAIHEISKKGTKNILVFCYTIAFIILIISILSHATFFQIIQLFSGILFLLFLLTFIMLIHASEVYFTHIYATMGVYYKNLYQFKYIYNKSQDFFQITKQETKHLPHFSLLFSDIITLLSKNIQERQKIIKKLQKSDQFFNFPILLIKKFFTINNNNTFENLIKNQNQQLLTDIQLIASLINEWKQTEIQKLKNLHINQEIPELALQSKRRELLIQNLENLK